MRHSPEPRGWHGHPFPPSGQYWELNWCQPMFYRFETDLHWFLIRWAHEWLCGPHVNHQRAEYKRRLTKGTTVHSPLPFPLKFSALWNQQTFAQASGRPAQSYAFGTKLQCWSSAQLPFHWSAPLHSNMHLTLTLTPRSPQKPKRAQWVTLMFILMHLSPHSWYKIRKSEAKTKGLES